MLLLKVIRPNTVGVTFTREFEGYAEAEAFIERKWERLADLNWKVSELKGSSSREGSIECTHDHEADVLIITWETLK